MTDWQKPIPLPLFVHTFTRWGGAAEVFKTASLGAPAASTWVANQAMYIPVAIPWPYPVKRVFWVNGSTITASNVDFGIYSASGARIFSTGSQTQTGASALQYVTPATPFILSPGLYYFAWTNSSTTSRAYAVIPSTANGRQCGLLTQATALPLPSAATFAAYAGTCGIPLCGITRASSGF